MKDNQFVTCMVPLLKRFPLAQCPWIKINWTGNEDCCEILGSFPQTWKRLLFQIVRMVFVSHRDVCIADNIYRYVFPDMIVEVDCSAVCSFPCSLHFYTDRLVKSTCNAKNACTDLEFKCTMQKSFCGLAPGNSPSERIPVRTKAFFILTGHKISF